MYYKNIASLISNIKAVSKNVGAVPERGKGLCVLQIKGVQCRPWHWHSYVLAVVIY